LLDYNIKQGLVSKSEMIEKKQKLPDYRQFLRFSNPPLFAKSGGLEKKGKR